jgi:hypothetical protein
MAVNRETKFESHKHEFVEDELDNFLQFNRFLGFIINNIILYSMLLWRLHHYLYFFTIVMLNAAEHRTRFDNAPTVSLSNRVRC